MTTKRKHKPRRKKILRSVRVRPHRGAWGVFLVTHLEARPDVEKLKYSGLSSEQEADAAARKLAAKLFGEPDRRKSPTQLEYFDEPFGPKSNKPGAKRSNSIAPSRRK